MAEKVKEFSNDDLNSFIMDLVYLEYNMQKDKVNDVNTNNLDIKLMEDTIELLKKNKTELNESEKTLYNMITVIIVPILKNIVRGINKIPTDKSLYEILKFAIPIINRLKETPNMKLEDVHKNKDVSNVNKKTEQPKKILTHEELRPQDDITLKILKEYDDNNLIIMDNIRTEFNWNGNKFNEMLELSDAMDFDYSSDGDIINIA